MKEKSNSCLIHKYMGLSALGWTLLILAGLAHASAPSHGGSTGNCVVYDGLICNGSFLSFIFQQTGSEFVPIKVTGIQRTSASEKGFLSPWLENVTLLLSWQTIGQNKS